MAEGGEARVAPARLAIVSAMVMVLSVTLFLVAMTPLLGPLASLSDWPGDGRAAFWLRASPNGFPTRSSVANPRRGLWRQPLGASEGQQLSQIFRFRHDPGDRPALLLPVIDGEFAVFVNGVRAPVEGRAAQPYLALSGARAWLWPIPLDLIRPGDNRIDLVIGPARGRVLRAPLHVGPIDRLEPVMTAITRIESLARPGLTVLGLVAAGLSLLAGAASWTARPWIALAAAAAAVGARALVSAPDVVASLGPVWRPADLALLAATLVCAGLAAHRSGWAGQGTARCALAVPAAALLAGVVGATGLAWGVWTLAVEALYVTALAALLLVLSVASTVTAGPALSRRMLQWADLGRTVRRQRAEIQAASAALQQEMRRSAILEERQRLARDMHDGIGGQLVSLLARVRTRRISLDQMETELVGGLSELRLLVDSLDAVGESLSGALAAFRARIRPQAEAAGMTLIWTAPDDLDIEASDPRWILNLYRLLQEAVTNAVRHAGGGTLTIRVGRRGPRGLTIVVEDDGAGFDPATVERGKGLANMEVRAAQLGADLRWTVPVAGVGTAVKIELVVPDRPPPTSPAR